MASSDLSQLFRPHHELNKGDAFHYRPVGLGQRLRQALA